jgi:hypothetical protein
MSALNPALPIDDVNHTSETADVEWSIKSSTTFLLPNNFVLNIIHAESAKNLIQKRFSIPK